MVRDRASSSHSIDNKVWQLIWSLDCPTKVRCGKVMAENQLQGYQVVYKIQQAFMEWRSVRENLNPKIPSSPSVSNVNDTWEAPAKGWIKVNYDGAFCHKIGDCGIGLVARNESAQILEAYGKFRKGDSALVAEAMAIKEATHLTDWRIQPIVVDIQNLLKLLPHAEIRVIKRAANMAADCIGINVTPRIRNAESHTSTTTTRRFSFYYGAKNGGELMLRVARRRHLRPNAVLVPSETKTLHLYEARYLALLEESLLRKKLFVHFVLDPISIGNSGAEASFAARYGCLVFIESIERLDVGALVSIRGIGRVKILKFLQADPYLKGEVRPKQDEVLDGTTNLTSKILQVKEALQSLNKLEIKLKTPKEAPLQTSCLNSLQWAESELSLECDKGFFPSSAERVSFAAFQPVSGRALISHLHYVWIGVGGGKGKEMGGRGHPFPCLD
ncbi:hypothetical protein CCACVL1_05205 [Corchorus capsularis]|uniref:Lon N-terminal domain-containing protein n=1 Tax=Corchorus capsularis TaxID=210143 RepID=A0A1R3JM33_COCAP|nr:hypothetical protein CCACVL1_05205 [Corchorus capsularis]